MELYKHKELKIVKTNQNKNQSREDHKIRSRVAVNGILLFLMAIIFGVLTWCGSSRIAAYERSHGAFVASDGSSICF